LCFGDPRYGDSCLGMVVRLSKALDGESDFRTKLCLGPRLFSRSSKRIRLASLMANRLRRGVHVPPLAQTHCSARSSEGPLPTIADIQTDPTPSLEGMRHRHTVLGIAGERGEAETRTAGGRGTLASCPPAGGAGRIVRTVTETWLW